MRKILTILVAAAALVLGSATPAQAANTTIWDSGTFTSWIIQYNGVDIAKVNTGVQINFPCGSAWGCNPNGHRAVGQIRKLGPATGVQG